MKTQEKSKCVYCGGEEPIYLVNGGMYCKKCISEARYVVEIKQIELKKGYN